MVGLGGGDMPPIPMRALVHTGVTIQGIFVGSKKALADLLELIREGKVSTIFIIPISLALT